MDAWSKAPSRIFGSQSPKGLFAGIFVLVCLWGSFLWPANGASANRPPRQTFSAKSRALQNLAKAKAAIQSGRRKDAERFWQVAKALDPTLPFPIWLAERSQQPPPADVRASSREEFFRTIGALPYEQAQPLMEDWLARFPQDVEVRNLFREAAGRAGDQAQVVRHETAIRQGSTSPGGHPWFKALLLVLVAGVAVWQAREAWRDWKG